MLYGADVANTNTKHKTLIVTTTGQLVNGTANSTTNLKDRKYIYLWAQEGPVFWSFDSALTSANYQQKACGSLDAGAQELLAVGPNLSVYICTATATASVAITEIS